MLLMNKRRFPPSLFLLVISMSDELTIEMPNGWNPRRHQMPLWNFLERGGKRAVAVWHRRAGKDSLSLNFTAEKMLERVGVYWHMLPTAKQARKVVWSGVDGQQRKIIDQAFPKELRAKTNEQEMLIEFFNGSIWQCVGSDNYNALVGANPVGVVFSEYSLTDPAAWEFIRPILAENGGWALFIFTPRGKNHAYDLFEMAKTNPKWFCQKLTVDDTGIINHDVIEEERAAGMDEDMIQQEFYCSFDAAVKGTYYSRLIADAEKDGRIGDVPYMTDRPVTTAWDIGMNDATGIWFYQKDGAYYNIIDYYEGSDVGLNTYLKVLRDKGYTYSPKHIFPHDINVREWTSGDSRKKILERSGFGVKTAPKESVDEGIEAVRNILPLCRFDANKCKRGLNALREYHKFWNDKMKDYMPKPCHDWTSHGADAFRYLALTARKMESGGWVNRFWGAGGSYDPLAEYD